MKCKCINKSIILTILFLLSGFEAYSNSQFVSTIKLDNTDLFQNKVSSVGLTLRCLEANFLGHSIPTKSYTILFVNDFPSEIHQLFNHSQFYVNLGWFLVVLIFFFTTDRQTF